MRTWRRSGTERTSRSRRGRYADVRRRPLGDRPPIALATARPGTAAVEACRALADCLGVPFRFASLNLPDDEAPRRRRAQGLSGGA